jgi:hypothetical protein
MNYKYCVRFEVLTATDMEMAAFWDAVLCRLVDSDRRFRGAYCLHHHPLFLTPWSIILSCSRRIATYYHLQLPFIAVPMFKFGHAPIIQSVFWSPVILFHRQVLSLLSSGYSELPARRHSDRAVKPISHPPVMSKLRIHGALPPRLLFYFHAVEQLYLRLYYPTNTCGRKQSWPVLVHCLQGLSNTMKAGQYSWPVSWGWNFSPPK